MRGSPHNSNHRRSLDKSKLPHPLMLPHDTTGSLGTVDSSSPIRRAENQADGLSHGTEGLATSWYVAGRGNYDDAPPMTCPSYTTRHSVAYCNRQEERTWCRDGANEPGPKICAFSSPLIVKSPDMAGRGESGWLSDVVWSSEGHLLLLVSCVGRGSLYRMDEVRGIVRDRTHHS